jgi:PKD repeat protein
MRKRAAGIGLALLTVGALIGQVSIASASGTNQSTLVSASPSTKTPNISDGVVYAIAEVGSRIIVGGSFTGATPPGDTNLAHKVTQKFILAFNSSTGAIDTGFAPLLDGVVQSLKPGPTPDTVYVGGEFNHVNGATSKGVALISTSTGQKVSGFNPPGMDGLIFSLARSGNHLLIAGTFTELATHPHGGIASINATTGALEDSYITVSLTGHHNYTGVTGQANGGVGPRGVDVSPDGTKAVVIGNFKQANGVTHDQIVRLDLGATSGTVNSWNTSGYTAKCVDTAFDTYLRDVSFSPDGSYFVIAATGGGTFTLNTDGSRSLCDTATRWNTNSTGTNVQPVWINYSGNDSLLSVATTGTAIYVGGHERWSNNALASDAAGPGAVPRPGVMALDPVNGMPFSWNPGRNPRGSGAWALLPTASGLFMGSDTDKIGTGATYTTRGRIAFFPLAGGEAVPQYATPTLPTNVYLAGGVPTTQQTKVLYRVNAAGPTLPPLDSGPAWESDQVDPGPYRSATVVTGTSSWSQVASVSSVVPSTTPIGVFSTERWDSGTKGDGQEMIWSFPIPAGTHVTVRLFFANHYSGTSTIGKRKFDVVLDGKFVLQNYDIIADVGNNKGTMKSFNETVPSSGSLYFYFVHELQNPLVNGIEIINNDAVTPPAGSLDTLKSRSFTGTSAGATTALASSGIQWGNVRGAFMSGNQLYYGYSDGKLYRASFNGTTVGTPALVDPYNDPVWSTVDTGSGQTFRGAVSDMYGAEMQSVTGMALSGGNLYYSLYGDPLLHYRHFEGDDGVLGSKFVAGGDVNFANATGLFLAGNTLYYADRATGDLHAVAWNNGAPSNATNTVVSGPAKDGNDWRARGLFALPAAAPTAAFSSTCADLACSFDASASVAPGASIASYAWTFGDGGTATGPTPSHTYASAGQYTVSLTVTSSLGAQSIVSHSVQPFISTGTSISYVGASHVNGNGTTMSVGVPANVQSGDGLLLFVSVAGQPTITAPAGWTLVGSPATNTSLTSQVYRRVAASSDAGTSVSVTFAGTPHSALQILAYRGTNATNFVVSGSANAVTGGSTVTTPPQSVASGSDWVVSYFAAKSSTVTGWTVTGGQTTRDVDNGSGSGRINALLLDSGGPVLPGTVGGFTGTADTTFGGATGWTIILTS